MLLNEWLAIKSKKERANATNVIRGGFTKKRESRQAGVEKRGLSSQGRIQEKTDSRRE